MDQQRKHYLHTQYVLSIINDGHWYEAYGHKLDKPTPTNGVLKDLPAAAVKYVRPIEQDLGDELSIYDRAYIYMAIAAYYGHRNEAVRDAMPVNGNFRPAMTRVIDGTTAPQTPTQQEAAPMNQTNAAVAFDTRHYVFGQDVSNMTEDQLVGAIKRIEAEIADLKSVKTKSAKLAAKVKDLEAMLAKVVEVLDAK